MTQPHPQPDYDPIFNGLINYFKEMEWQRIEDDISIHEIIEILTDFAKMEKEEIATHTPAVPATEYTIEQITENDNRIRKERKAEREKVLLKYQNWVAKEAKMALNGETRALVVRLNSKLIKEIESLRGGDF